MYLWHIDEKRKNSYDGVDTSIGKVGKIMEQRILQYRKQIDEWLTENGAERTDIVTAR